MRKLTLMFLITMVVLCGCSTTKKSDKESMKTYESFIDAVATNKGIESKIIPFDYKLNVFKQEDNTYQYEVVISNPSIAMYHIQALALNPDVDSNTNVHPCLGLLGEDVNLKFNMVPYQSNPQRGFYRGFSLEGVSEKSQFTLHVMVTWKDSALLKENRVFFNLSFAQEVDDDANGKKETADTPNQ